jgi:hypothetical protein
MQDQWELFYFDRTTVQAEGSFFRQTQFLIKKYVFITIFHAISNRCQMKIFRKHEFEITNDIVFIQGFIAACDIHFSFFVSDYFTEHQVYFGGFPKSRLKYDTSHPFIISVFIFGFIRFCQYVHMDKPIYRLFWVFFEDGVHHFFLQFHPHVRISHVNWVAYLGMDKL